MLYEVSEPGREDIGQPDSSVSALPYHSSARRPKYNVPISVRESQCKVLAGMVLCFPRASQVSTLSIGQDPRGIAGGILRTDLSVMLDVSVPCGNLSSGSLRRLRGTKGA